ncbi:TetR/AcrR family transcriptional regulator [Neokomagataea anthophila]|uniref:TetR/AcrR family transcriptional regulator n=1 Tax=Neokomagataea anthophila TaxID=2826925 RepID=A0ABS5E3L5_9PROT|nr:TetR/AcrR family transcriptional regulator [Neokomagataea anthophila]MBR0558497.1 TetR/AcrR family transcriptional regulator [Neokomagataea anthophila]
MPRIATDHAKTLSILADVFREYGYDGTSLGLITQATGLGKGSLYHMFPGGKAEMMSAVLTEIDTWFETRIYAPLRNTTQSHDAIPSMLDAVTQYFRSGERVCLMGVLSVSNQRDQFAGAIAQYFSRWIDALTLTLQKQCHQPSQARLLAEETILHIQGAIILSRALNDPALFQRSITQLHDKLSLRGR